jgi:hypothetical protein
MTGGTVWTIGTWDTSMLNISGGRVTGAVLTYNQSTVNVSGTCDIFSVQANVSSTVNVYGGTIGILGVQGATVNLYGGAITSFLEAYPNSTVNVFGTSLSKASTGGAWGYGWVHGFWQDTSEFTINFAVHETYSHVNLITIPEPATAFLLILGAFVVRVRRA